MVEGGFEATGGTGGFHAAFAFRSHVRRSDRLLRAGACRAGRQGRRRLARQRHRRRGDQGPGVEGVTCHVSYFDRGIIDRLQKGNWFEDPSDSSISCRQTGPISIGDIDLSEDGEEVFKQGISLIWKKQVVNRIYDKANDTLIYLSHSRQVQDGSAKMSISTVPLYGQNVTWKNGKPK